MARDQQANWAESAPVQLASGLDDIEGSRAGWSSLSGFQLAEVIPATKISDQLSIVHPKSTRQPFLILVHQGRNTPDRKWGLPEQLGSL